MVPRIKIPVAVPQKTKTHVAIVPCVPDIKYRTSQNKREKQIDTKSHVKSYYYIFSIKRAITPMYTSQINKLEITTIIRNIWLKEKKLLDLTSYKRKRKTTTSHVWISCPLKQNKKLILKKETTTCHVQKSYYYIFPLKKLQQLIYLFQLHFLYKKSTN